ncbi:polysaccharide deacetylase family protein [Alkalihalobacillus pseudalcaliphilus]|uniref:polysaccharide deacetylase family protein n=1 Tax=Alkalihalobacillus pseudalcaliphilus TaxID=79884 RepID=UPI00064DA23D|nr:polysaccharide deacetylase family protein [Alkalihalobacillus pseudalcaliphilus]KMK75141.1 polysaccharide deacetylase [Alkalihalobacillus pseudalcaliphilus]
MRKLYWFPFLSSVSLLFLLVSTVSAEDSMLAKSTFYVDGQPFESHYLMRDGEVYIPSLFIKETGAQVDWNEEYQTVLFKGNDQTFSMPLDKKTLLTFNEQTKNWEEKKLKAGAILFDDQTFVPLKTVIEELGMTSHYEPQSAKTFIQSNIDIQPNYFAQGSRNNRFIALTFDDGPDTYYTPLILDILKEKGVHATFFVVGKQVQKHPDILKRIVEEGHGIGNHTFNHPNLTKTWSEQVQLEIEKTQSLIQDTVGRKPSLIRPPYGAFTKADIGLFNDKGLVNVMWSVDTLDWSGLPAEDILETVLTNAFPGSIVLQHNFQAEEHQLDGSLEALPQMIDELKKRGYTFVTVQTLMDSD